MYIAHVDYHHDLRRHSSNIRRIFPRRQLLVCALDGDDKRPLHRLAAIGISDAELLPLAASFEELFAQIERAGLT
jgi:hypothetical protein